MNGTSPDVVVRALQLYKTAGERHAARNWAGADALYREAIALLPSHPQILASWAQLAEDVKDWPAAEQRYRRLGAVSPAAGVEGKLAVMLFNQALYADALPLLEAHLPRQPDNPDLRWMLGFCLHKAGEFVAALPHAERLYRVQPGPRAARLLVTVLADLGRRETLDALKDDFLTLYANDPKVSGVIAGHLLKSGDLAGGFARLDSIRACFDSERTDYRELPVPAWDGVPFDGTLLVAAEQGLGEEILAASLYDDLVAAGQRCLIEAEPRLLPLFRRRWPGLALVPRGGGGLLAAVRAGGSFRKAMALDLAAHGRRERAAVPARPAWLEADAARCNAFRNDYRARLPGRRLAALSWKSRRQIGGHDAKSLALVDLGAILSAPGWRVLNAQYGDIAADLAAVSAAGLLAPWQDPAVDATADLDALAAQLAALDLVITTSNTTAHLAGALGLRTWLLLPESWPVLWYWGYEGERTPWYPSVRILRNDNARDWTGLAARVARDLAAVELP